MTRATWQCKARIPPEEVATPEASSNEPTWETVELGHWRVATGYHVGLHPFLCEGCSVTPQTWPTLCSGSAKKQEKKHKLVVACAENLVVGSDGALTQHRTDLPVGLLLLGGSFVGEPSSPVISSHLHNPFFPFRVRGRGKGPGPPLDESLVHRRALCAFGTLLKGTSVVF